ncbi:MAG: 16S rRNA (guanine(527)-N(7))-methyltransferase RsmG [Spirochaetales bacterium]
MDTESAVYLEKGLERLGLKEEKIRTRCYLFLQELERWNSRFSFVHDTGKDLVVRHLLDCLAGLSIFASFNPTSIADLGSGAGFPGIPLAVGLPDVSFTLIEPSRKRAAFLKSVQSLLGLSNVRIWETNLESLPHHLKPEDRFFCITFRAFTPLTPKKLKQMFPLLLEKGFILAYKGKREILEQEVRIATPGYKVNIIPLHVPFLEEERHLLWISR